MAILLLLFGALGTVGTLLGYVTVLSWTVPPASTPFRRQEVLLSSPDAAIRSFQEFLRLPTVCDTSAPLHVGDTAAFAAAIQHLRTTYADVLQRPDVTVTSIANYSLLVEWRGSHQAPGLLPIMVYGHYDVVPVGEDSLPQWRHAPFAGDIHDGFVWGRGTIDMKGTVIALFEALQQLHRNGFQPQRSILLGIGHDEETGGREGAAAIAAHLHSQQRRVALFWDEGLPVFNDGLGGFLNGPVALIGTAEKGREAFKLTIKAAGGHASMPPLHEAHAARIMADVVKAIDTTAPPTNLRAPMSDMLRRAAPHAPFFLRGVLAYASVQPFNRLMSYAWSQLGPATNALVRTTAAPTMVNMGVAHNVLPMHGEILVDMRVLPGDGGDQPLGFVNAMVAASGHADKVTVTPSSTALPPSEVTASNGHWWELMERAVAESLVPHSLQGEPLSQQPPVLPSLLVGRTDSARFAHLTDGGIFRFMPFSLNRTAGDLKRVHGIDERLHTNTFLSGLRFYTHALAVLSNSTVIM